MPWHPMVRAAALSLAVLLAAPAAHAARAGRVEAEVTRLSKEAHALYKEGQFREAAQTLLRAYELKPVPELLFNVARSYDEAGDLEDAMRYYRRYLDLEGGKPELVKRAARALDRLQQDLDRKKEAERAEKEAEEQRRRAADDEKRIGIGPSGDLAGDRVPPPAARPAGGQTWAYVAAGVATAGLAAGLGFGLAANNAKSELAATDELVVKQTLADSAQGRALVADVGYGIAAVAGGVALWLFLAPQGGGEKVSVGPSGSGVALAF